RATEASHDGLAAGHGRSRAAADTRAGACTAGPPGCSGPHSSRRERSDAEEDTDPGHDRPDDEVGARRNGRCQRSRYTGRRTPAVAPHVLALAAHSILAGASAQSQKNTLVPGTAVPMTRSAHAGTAAVGGRGTPDVARRRLADLESALFHESPPVRSSKRAKTAAADTPARQPGEIAVLRMPNARHDVAEARTRPRLEITGGPSRVIVLGAGGDVLLDGPPVRNAVTLAEGAERIAVLALGDGDPVAGGLSGWHAGQ